MLNLDVAGSPHDFQVVGADAGDPTPCGHTGEGHGNEQYQNGSQEASAPLSELSGLLGDVASSLAIKIRYPSLAQVTCHPAVTRPRTTTSRHIHSESKHQSYQRLVFQSIRIQKLLHLWRRPPVAAGKGHAYGRDAGDFFICPDDSPNITRPPSRGTAPGSTTPPFQPAVLPLVTSWPHGRGPSPRPAPHDVVAAASSSQQASSLPTATGNQL